VLRFCSLGSGSGGNAWVVEASEGLFATRVLIDNGFGPRQFDRRLQRVGLTLSDLDAVFLTHEHADHVGGVDVLLARCEVPLLTSAGTARAAGIAMDRRRVRPVIAGEAVSIGALCIEPFDVPHDAAQPLHFCFSDGAGRLAIVTDLGCATTGVAQALRGLHTLVLECNHDERLLANGGYPAFLKARIAGDSGHLSNAQAAELLRLIPGPRPSRVVAAHLSKQNNQPQLAQRALAQVLGCDEGDVPVADQAEGLGWIRVG
jgi:phosphoribosyl 1,2-cyclic phosphodiesterase